MAERLGHETQGGAAAVQADGFLWGEGSQSSAGSRGRGWTLVEGAVIGDAPSPGDLVLLNPRLGLALFQLEAHWTPDALARLEQRLAAAGFHEAFPGRLPAIHRRLRREIIPELPSILEEAFSLQPRLTLPEGTAWVYALRRVLTAAGPVSAADALPAAQQDAVARALSNEPAPAEVTGMAEAPLPPPRPEAETITPPQPPANDDAPRARGMRGLIATAGAVAAGVLVVMVMRGGQPEPAPTETPQPRQIAANTHATTRTDASPAVHAPSPPPPTVAGTEPEQARQAVSMVTADAAPPPAAPAAALAATPAAAPAPAPATAPEPVTAIEEPPAPRVDLALAAPPPPVIRIVEPPAPRIEVAVVAPPPPVMRIEEPPAPRIEVALAAAPPPEAPIEEPPAPNIAAALAAAAPPPEAPIEEPPAPNVEAVLAADAPPPVAPIEEPPAPNIDAALAAAPAEGAVLPLPEDPPGFDLEAAIRSLGPAPERPAAPPAPAPAPAQAPAQAAAPSPAPAPASAPASAPAQAPAAAPAPAPAPVQAAAPAPAPPPAPAPAPAQAAAPAVARAPQAPVTPLAVPDPPAVIGAMLLRGEALMAIGDISGARRFFERAAASGSGAGALQMGATYDPTELARIGARGISPDRDRARAWYRYAEQLGERGAAERIATLEATR